MQKYYNFLMTELAYTAVIKKLSQVVVLEGLCLSFRQLASTLLNKVLANWNLVSSSLF